MANKINKTKNPAGLWENTDIIGSKCLIKNIPIGYGHRQSSFGFDNTEEHTIVGMYQRVTTDGKIYPVYLLEGIDNRLFNASEIQITGICYAAQEVDESKLCGEFNSGQ